jgi:acyl-CoA thioester hydrolase
MFENKTTIRVRYNETDQMSYVHHGNYASFFEMGRLEWLRNRGISYKEMEENGVMLPVYSLSTRFVSPAKYDDLLTISTRLKEIPTVRISFEYDIHNETGKLIAQGDTTLIFVNMKSGRPMKAPQYILDLLKD